jgi:four helix bundle protein
MLAFQNLLVYQRSLTLAVNLTKKASRFPSCYKRISDQIIGAATSVPLNIAEGTGRGSQKQTKAFVGIARGSAYEAIAIIDICLRLDLLSVSDHDAALAEYIEITKMLSGLIKSLK